VLPDDVALVRLLMRTGKPLVIAVNKLDVPSQDALLADTYLAAWQQPLDSDYQNSVTLDRGYQLACKALQLDPNLPGAHASIAYVFVFTRRHEAAIAEFEKVAMLNPNYTDWRFTMALVFGGDFNRAVQIGRAHMRMDPFYLPSAAMWIGAAFYMLKNYSAALPLLCECVARAPHYRAGHLWSAANYAQLGQLDAARAEIAEVLRIDPTFTIEGAARRTAYFKHQDHVEHAIDGARKAGLPDK
jgi:adenylate cyclase